MSEFADANELAQLLKVKPATIHAWHGEDGFLVFALNVGLFCLM
jgi:hypothetical protein